MLKKLSRLGISIALFLGCVTAVGGQADLYRDWVIPFGYDGDEENSYGVSVLDFRNGEVSTRYSFAAPGIRFGRDASSFYANETGEIVLLSDGCRLYDGELNILSGTGYLHPGTISDSQCSPTSNYPSSGGSIMLAGDNQDSIVYFVSTNMELDANAGSLISNRLGVWQLERTPTGQYQIINQQILELANTRIGRLTAYRNPVNPGQWWLPVVGRTEDEIRVFSVGGEELVEDWSALIVSMVPNGNVSRQAVFSPDGQHYAFTTQEGELHLFDFAATTGTLSGARVIDLPLAPASPAGICFSAQADFIYMTFGDCLYQYELEVDNLELIDCHSSNAEDGWPVGLGEMYLGPDCRIYVSPGSTTWYLHTIHDPDQRGSACDFQARAIRTPTRLHFSLPNTPIYRTEMECATVEWTFDPPVSTEDGQNIETREVNVYPNPARNWLQIETTQPLTTGSSLLLFQGDGRPVGHFNLVGSSPFSIDVQNLAAGLYYATLMSGEGKTLHRVKVVLL